MPNSPKPDTAANEIQNQRTTTTNPDDCQSVINSCAATVVDLVATKKLVASLENDKTLLIERLETEKRTTSLLTDLSTAKTNEALALREAINAKDAEIQILKDALAKKKNGGNALINKTGVIVLGILLAKILK